MTKINVLDIEITIKPVELHGFKKAGRVGSEILKLIKGMDK
jgi:hypothetical protein